MAIRRRVVAPTCLLCFALATCVEESSGPRSSGTRADVSDAASAAVFVGAGDIGDCKRIGDSLTANLLDGISGTVFALGDNAYPDGTPSDYANCYGPTWGRHKARTRPVPGNHDYNTAGAAGYFGYFGAAAGEPGKGYYSFNLGAWHIIALNSSIAMDAGSAQEQWLRADLAAHPALCTLAFWHHPLFSSSTIAVAAAAEATWQDLYDAGAELIINGHHHDYERFAPQTAAGVADAAHGIREFVVGTGGGEGLFPFGATAANSEVKDNETFGVLKLTLRADGYDWQFIPIPGKTFRDSGSGTCHDRPGSPPAENQPPTAGFTSSCSGLPCTFTSTSSDPDGTIASWRWTFGDGASSTEQNPTHTYQAGGTYTVNLTVTDDKGATGTTSKSVTVAAANQPPSASFSASCSGLTCGFTDASSDADGRVVARSEEHTS